MFGRFFASSSLTTTSPTPSSHRYSLPMPITKIGDILFLSFGHSCPPDRESYPGDRKPQGSLPHATPPLNALDVQLQKVRGAGNARIVVADRLLALPCELLLGQFFGLL